MLPAETDEAAKRGVEPAFFHAANILLHAAVSALVCRLAYFMLTRRWAHVLQSGSWGQGVEGIRMQGKCLVAADKGAAVEGAVVQGGALIRGHGSGKLVKRRSKQQPVQQQQQSMLAAQPSSITAQEAMCSRSWRKNFCPTSVLVLHLPAWFAGLAFALHPIHTEAVAGVVGHAELLCAALALTAFFMYAHAAEQDVGNDPESAGKAAQGQEPQQAAAVMATATADEQEDESNTSIWRQRVSAGRQWALVFLSVALVWLAALAKEIGITMVGSLALYDLASIPLSSHKVRRKPQADSKQKQKQGRQGASSKAFEPFKPYSLVRRVALKMADVVERMWRLVQLGASKWARMLVLACAGLLYVRIRGAVASDHLVRIYRRVRGSCLCRWLSAQ